MTLSVICLLLVPLLAGALIVQLAWQNPMIEALPLKLSLGVGIGLGLTSLLYFIFLLLFPGKNDFFWLIVLLLFSLIIVTFRKGVYQKLVFKRPSLTWVQSILLGLLTASVTLATLTLINMTLTRPHGGFDAWLIWNRAARFIFRGAEHWQMVFSPNFFFFFQPDYPLLLPITTAWIWNTLGVETLRAPFIQAAVYLLGSAALLFSALRFTNSLGQACLAVILLFGAKVYVSVGASQISDVPLAFFILMTVVLFHLYARTRNHGLLILAGFSAGLCGWTKNEGNSFMLIASLALVAMLWSGKEKKGHFFSFLAGILLPAMVITYFKIYLAPPSDLIVGGMQDIQQIMDTSRYMLIGRSILLELKSFAGWPYLIPILILYYWLMKRPHDSDMGWHRIVGMMLCLQVMGYIAVYVISPYPLEFHLAHSFDRILLHVYPSFLYLLFSTTMTPESVFNRSTQALQSGNHQYVTHN